MKTDYFYQQRDWQAQWIWGNHQDANTYHLFRNEFTIGKKGTYRILITAETKYQLFVNGEFVEYGAPMTQPYYKYYNETDISKFLKKGTNTVGVIVYYTGWQELTRGGLLAEVLDNNDNVITATNQTWMQNRGHAWAHDTAVFRMQQYAPYQEIFDDRLMPVDWHKNGFDDSSWDPAVVLHSRGNRPPCVEPWIRLLPRDIPPMELGEKYPVGIIKTEEHIHHDVRCRQPLDLSITLSTVGKPIHYSTLTNEKNLLKDKGLTSIQCSTNHLDKVFDGFYDPSVTLDFGRVLTAYFEIDVDGPAGTCIDVGYAERLIDDCFVNSIEGWFADRFILKGGRTTLRCFNWKAFRFIKMRITNCFEKMKVHSVKAITTTYPFSDDKAFKSSNPILDKTYDICDYTIRLCTNEFIMDTPWREQGQWLGDVSAVTLGGIYSCFGDTEMPSKYLRQCAVNQSQIGLISNMTNAVSLKPFSSIPDYSLWYIIAVKNYYFRTGDEELLHEIHPVLIRIFQFFLPYIDDDGLLKNVPCWNLIDWAHIDFKGKSSALNALFYGTLESLAFICEFNNDNWNLEKIKSIRKRIKKNFYNTFLVKDKGCLSDANDRGTLSSRISEHGNMTAILYDLVTKTQAESIINNFYVKRTVDYTEAQPYYALFILKALKKVGCFDMAIQLIEDRWGERMVKKGAESLYEEWYENGSWRSGKFTGFMRTHSHAWGAGPAEFLTDDLINLEILEPGFKKIKLKPYKLKHDYQVDLKTPLGTIQVKQKQGKLSVKVPKSIAVLS